MQRAMKYLPKTITALKLGLAAVPSLVPLLSPSNAQLAYAATFTTIEQAKSEAFPAATHFEQIPLDGFALRPEIQIQRAYQGETLLGFFVTDAVIGKHLFIDYSVAFSPAGAIRRVEILEYRENYGSEVSQREWLENFSGKNHRAFHDGAEIPNISGATYSSKHITEGVAEIAEIIDKLLGSSR